MWHTVSQLAVVAPPLAAATLQQLRRCTRWTQTFGYSITQNPARTMTKRATAEAEPQVCTRSPGDSVTQTPTRAMTKACHR